MRQECINAVQQAASRRLTQQEIKNIEDRIYRNMRQLARNDPASWRAMTDAERLRRAGQLAANELTNEAALKKLLTIGQQSTPITSQPVNRLSR